MYCGYFLGSRIYNCNYIYYASRTTAQQLAELHLDSPNYGVITVTVGKTKWKLLELPLPKEKKLKQCSIPGYSRDCPHQGVEECDVVIPTIPIQLI